MTLSTLIVALSLATPDLLRLPPRAFPSLPSAVRTTLEVHRCSIPQTSPADGKTNVVHGHFRSERRTDYAVLCSRGGASNVYVINGVTGARSSLVSHGDLMPVISISRAAATPAAARQGVSTNVASRPRTRRRKGSAFPTTSRTAPARGVHTTESTTSSKGRRLRRIAGRTAGTSRSRGIDGLAPVLKCTWRGRRQRSTSDPDRRLLRMSLQRRMYSLNCVQETDAANGQHAPMLTLLPPSPAGFLAALIGIR